ncbi:tail fiber domain-containing protein [Litoribrevibacter euphylliae]|uniref:Tail fiber domain-containing protein n=1 Tax=Litoribrevibacter euphylliae TaxID=1834034 RepID=A0ABV7HFM0_9GAMM
MTAKVIKTTSLAALFLASPYLSADTVILDDHIVDGSQCVGTDCVNGESFGFDTLRLKENNIRIRFRDTSTTSSFPTTDWQLVANETSNGGQSMFAIEDLDASTIPFMVEAGAGDYSVYIDSSDKVGFGTSSPLMDMHLVAGDSPALRLEQDTSSGFSSQSWDLGGNESNFFLRDATNSSKLPFKVAAGAATDSLVIDSSGNVSSEGQICSNAGGVADCIGTIPSSIHIKQIVEYVDTAEVLETVSQLSMPKWFYKANGESIQHIGPIAEEFQAAFGLNGGVSDKIATVDLGGVALASIQELSKQVKQKDKEIAELREELAEIKQLLLQK